MSKPSKNSNVSLSFKFGRHSSIGFADAIEDGKFLQDAFIDNGEMAILLDTTDARSLLVGRTGVGKTALIEKVINSGQKVINIQPESLSLAFLADNENIKFFQDLGVNMDLFYKLLWKHVFTIEIIKSRYGMVSQSSERTFLEKLNSIRPSQKRKDQVVDYLRKWGASFWQDTDYRIKEVTSKLEEDLKSGLSTEIKGKVFNSEVGGKIGSDREKKLTKEETAEVISHGQKVVNSIQIATLNDVFLLLEEDILDDTQKRYYITIDRLDENWVDETMRYNLIQALLDTMREFNYKLKTLKIICAIREDLINRVFRFARKAGYQEEKFKALYLPIYWSEDDLESLLDERINVMARLRFTSQSIRIRDFLPDSIAKEDSFKYIIERTLMRPRDAIAFFNECIKMSNGKSKITREALLQAEPTYSLNRLNALSDEWAVDYPNLYKIANLLDGFPRSFKSYEVESRLVERVLSLMTDSRLVTDESIVAIANLIQNHSNADLTDFILDILFVVGIIGISRPSFQNVRWSFNGYTKSGNDIDDQTSYYVHKAFWKVLSIK